MKDVKKNTPSNTSNSQEAQENLHLDPNRYKVVANNLPGAIFQYILNEDGSDRMTNLSKGSELLWDLSPQEAMNDISKVWRLVHPEDLEGFKESVDESAKELSYWNHEWRLKMPDGSIRWHRGMANPRKEGTATIWDTIILDVTDTKKTQIALEESEERYRNVFNQQFQFVALLDLKGRIIQINDLPLIAQGMSRDEYIGKYFWDSPGWDGNPEWQEKVKKQVLQAKSTGEPYITEDHFYGNAKEVRVGKACYSVIKNSDGEIINVLVQAMDITEEKAAQETIKKSQEQLKEANLKYELATKNKEFGIWDWDVKNDILTWDEGLYAMYGIDPKEFKNANESWEAALHPADKDRAVKEIDKALTSKENSNMLFRIIRHNDRAVKHIRSLAQMVTNEEGEVVRMVGMNIDITNEIEQRIAFEKALTDRNKILDSISDGFFTVNSEWRITDWNKSAGLILSRPAKEALGHNLWDIFEDTISLKFHIKYHNVMETKQSSSFEEFYAPKGLWISVDAYPKDNGISVFFRDITNQKMHQEEVLEKSLRSMERERNRISQELHDGVLQEMVGSLILSNKMVESLSGTEKSLSYGQQLVTYLKKSIEDTRRISHNLKSPEFESNTLVELIQNRVEQLNEIHDITFSFMVDDEISQDDFLFTESQKTNIYRILQELLTNSVKHSRADEVSISMWKQQEHYFFQVEDNGIGMDIEKLYSKRGIGFRNIKDRIILLGGSFNVIPQKGKKGTSVLIKI